MGHDIEIDRLGAFGIRALLAGLCVTALVAVAGCQADSADAAGRCAELLGEDEAMAVGMHSDQPGLNFQESDATRSGFDYEFAKWLGQYCDLTVLEQDLSTSQREDVLKNDKGVDLVIATYSITDERKKAVSFAGPYLETQQGVMVRDSSKITSAADLAGKKVCAARGSTSWEQILVYLDDVTGVQADGFGDCAALLREGKVDAVSTDQIILYGYEHEYEELRVLPDERFGHAELYGIGIPHGKAELCHFLNEAIVESIRSGWWVQQFKNNLPDHLDPGDFKPVDRDLGECPDEEEAS